MSEQLPVSIEPWLLLGDRRRRVLETRVRAAVERWAASWVAAPLSLTITLEPASCARLPTCSARRMVSFAVRGALGKCAAVASAPACLAAWAAGLGVSALTALAESDEDSIAAEAELELIKGLWAEFTVGLSAEEDLFERLGSAAAASQSEVLPARGTRVICHLGPVPDFAVHWILSPSTVAAMLAEPGPLRAQPPLMSRRKAVGQSAIEIDCHLGCIELPVRDLHELRLGVVLLMDVALDARAELKVRNGTGILAKGALGESEGRRAIKIESAHRGI